MQKIRKGRYTLLNGREYKIYENDNLTYELISDSPEDVNYGFKEEYSSTYVKIVDKSEFSTVYEVTPYAKYKGRTFDVSLQIKDGKVSIGTTNAELAKELSLERTDKYFYEKWVPLKDVKILEDIKER
ncbi:hypothetical protein L1999_01750 [Neobacillus drentensis]|uniref:hypothetical protein n=1 Tax=Neobacillus drentensis TaxID=220684 RepID=UPI001F24E979|nr:hypothetical protein [Neobacillus drentensis]ULT57363.1 hypothetical protein L1999_01750 [Neobacillus drentensis]